jgi:hypothetical protein
MRLFQSVRITIFVSSNSTASEINQGAASSTELISKRLSPVTSNCGDMSP